MKPTVIAALIRVSKYQDMETTKYPLMIKWVNKMLYTHAHTHTCNTYIKNGMLFIHTMNKTSPFLIAWMGVP